MTNLPIYTILEEIERSLSRSSQLIIEAPPGAGKSTIVPYTLLNASFIKGRILMLEPRRLAAKSIANRIASLVDEPLGKRVGYQIKGEHHFSKETKLLIITEGILTRMLLDDPELSGVSLVIFDEFHERNIHSDFALALLLESQEVLRDDLKLIVMSATLNLRSLQKILPNAKSVQSMGREYEIVYHYLPSAYPMPSELSISRLIVEVVQHALKEEKGSILIFLAGAKEIKETLVGLGELESRDIIVAPLYGGLDKKEQEAAIAPAPKGKRKIVLATNIAQTSLTIEGIRIVIDSGLERVMVFNPDSGMGQLRKQFISQDSASQRAGRAGRMSAGSCYRLWHKGRLLQESKVPEIVQSDLCSFTYDLLAWGSKDPNTLSWIDPPPKKAWNHGISLLQKLSLVDEKLALYPSKIPLMRLGLHPRLCAMLWYAKENTHLKEAILLATFLSERHTIKSKKSALRVDSYIEEMRETLIASHNVKRTPWYATYRSLCKRLDYHDSDVALDSKIVGTLLLVAYPDRVAQRREGQQNSFLLSSAKGGRLVQREAFLEAEYLVVVDLHEKKEQVDLFLAQSVTRQQIYETLGHLICDDKIVEIVNHKISARSLEKIGAIVLKEERLANISVDQYENLFLDYIKINGLSVLHWSKSTLQWRQRVLFYASYYSDSNIVDISDEALLASLDRWLLPFLSGCRTVDDLNSLDVKSMLQSMIDYETQKSIDEKVPKSFLAPTGSSIPINYESLEHPRVDVRVQELYGLDVTPSIADKRIALTLHLLSPAHREIAITNNIVRFWNEGYSDMKKELKGRYPKYFWPDDPHYAQATNRSKKFMKD
jgi:ATP-dependent helicase HrpB